MPPRTPSYDVVRAALDAQWDLLVEAFAEAEPEAPSRCAGWTVTDLQSHVAWTAHSLVRVLAEPAPAGPPAGGVSVWAAAVPELAAAIDADARQAARSLAGAVAAARDALAGVDPERLVQQRTGTHRLADAVLFRLVEAVVHGRDLPQPLEPDRGALRLVVRALTGVLVERAPGRTVEVRVPPYSAVQCVEGPRHTRGTPPNVVEVDPLAFVELGTGRLDWQQALRDGRLRASGERATEVAELLPLLR